MVAVLVFSAAGLGVKVGGLGFRVQGLGFGFRVQGVGVQGLWCRV